MTLRDSSSVAFAVLAALAVTASSASASPAAPEPPTSTGPRREPPAVPWLALPSPTPASAWTFTDRARPPATPAGVGLDPLDENWQSRFGLPVPNSGIEVLLPYGGLLIAGGRFSRIGRLEAPGLAAWDGTGWSLLGDFPGTRVVELAPYPGGFVALGPGGAGADVWRWTGASWQSLGPLPPVHEVFDMAVTGDTIAVAAVVYVAGEWHSRVCLYTGQGWTVLSDDIAGTIYALAWYGGALHAGGISSSVEALVSRWDGSAWQAIDGGLARGPTSWVSDLAVFDGELVAGGPRLDVTDPLPASFVRWNGSTWTTLGSSGPQYPNLRRIRVVGGDLYALGSFYSRYGIARWDGTTWHLAEDSLQIAVYDVASYQDRLYAGGPLSIDGSRPATPLVVREGGQWRAPIDPGADMHGFLGWSGPMVTGLTALDGAILAAGRFDFAGATGGWRRCAGGARWDGLEWSPLGFESFDYAYPQNLTIHDGAVFAVGTFFGAGEGSVARLEGGEWRLVGGDYATPFYNVYGLASALGDLFIGGAVDPRDAFRGIARWDGTRWHSVGGGVTSGSWISEIVAYGADVVVAGSFEEVGGIECHNIAAWNPATGWRALGVGLDGIATDLLARDGALHVSGWFAHAGGVAVTGIARWRDGQWEALPPLPRPVGYAADVWSLGWYRGRLVASGYDVPGLLASLQPDGTWRPLGSGLDAPATAMVESGPSLFVGGYFSRAGAADAYGFAEWREGERIGPPLLSRAAPNPFASAVHLRYELTAGAPVRVEIFDLAGHQVDRVFEGFQGAGPHEVAWRPEASRVRPGVYFARITTSGGSRIVRVIRVN